MIANSQIWYWTFDKSGDEVRLPAVYLKTLSDEKGNFAKIEILENEFEPSGIVTVDVRDCVARKI